MYKTTNLVNGKIYIGKHITEDPNDRYLGSGHLFYKAVRKYGVKNFKKEVLFIFDNEEEMLSIPEHLGLHKTKEQHELAKTLQEEQAKKRSQETRQKLKNCA